MSDKLFEYEAAYLRAGLEQLKAYLLQEEIFWNLGLGGPKGQAPYPQMTLGNLLLSAAKLGGLKGSEAQGQAVGALEKQLDGMRREWQTAWTAKAKKEFGVRLRQWERAVDEISKQPTRHAASFANEVRVRAELELLKEHLDAGSHAEVGELAVLDNRLRRVTREGDFVWGDGVEGGFSKGKFWFLWRRVKGA